MTFGWNTYNVSFVGDTADEGILIPANGADYQVEEISPEIEKCCQKLWELYIALKVTGDYKNVAAYKSVRPVSYLS